MGRHSTEVHQEGKNVHEEGEPGGPGVDRVLLKFESIVPSSSTPPGGINGISSPVNYFSSSSFHLPSAIIQFNG